ncbi:3342_t:CDS:2, partial [Ambispora leptoticha]
MLLYESDKLLSLFGEPGVGGTDCKQVVVLVGIEAVLVEEQVVLVEERVVSVDILVEEDKLGEVLLIKFSEEISNQDISADELDDNIWELPEYSPSEYDSNDSIILKDEDILALSHSDIEIDPSLANVSPFAECDFEDYESASLEDDFDDLQNPPTIKWPNEAYYKFIEIVNKHQLSNSAVEANMLANVYQPLSSRRPCYSCLVSNNNLNNISLAYISPRTPINMKQVIDSGEEQYYSIHPERNAFWEI